MPSTSLLTNITKICIFIYYTFIISTLNIENFKKKRNEPKKISPCYKALTKDHI